MAVIADLIRNPVAAQHWMPDQVRHDSNHRCTPPSALLWVA
jgi:hypothetical protein